MAKKDKKSEESDLTKEQRTSLQLSKALRARAAASGVIALTKPEQYPRLNPSKALVACSGHDIVKKSTQRKGKYLFAFPGRIAPIAGGGKLGQLEGLDTPHPFLYIEFPQGRYRLSGTIVPVKNRLVTLQCNAKAAKRAVETNNTSTGAVVCEDVFDKMVVFSCAEWVGTGESPVQEPESIGVERSSTEYSFSIGCGRPPRASIGSAGAGADRSGSKPPTLDFLQSPEAGARLPRRAAAKRVRYTEIEENDIQERDIDLLSDDDEHAGVGEEEDGDEMEVIVTRPASSANMGVGQSFGAGGRGVNSGRPTFIAEILSRTGAAGIKKRAVVPAGANTKPKPAQPLILKKATFIDSDEEDEVDEEENDSTSGGDDEEKEGEGEDEEYADVDDDDEFFDKEVSDSSPAKPVKKASHRPAPKSASKQAAGLPAKRAANSLKRKQSTVLVSDDEDDEESDPVSSARKRALKSEKKALASVRVSAPGKPKTRKPAYAGAGHRKSGVLIDLMSDGEEEENCSDEDYGQISVVKGKGKGKSGAMVATRPRRSSSGSAKYVFSDGEEDEDEEMDEEDSDRPKKKSKRQAQK